MYQHKCKEIKGNNIVLNQVHAKTRDAHNTFKNFYTEGFTHQKLLKYMKAMVSRGSSQEGYFKTFSNQTFKISFRHAYTRYCPRCKYLKIRKD